jgi:hypothetical protein
LRATESEGDASQMSYVPNGTKRYNTKTTSYPARRIRNEFVEFYIAVDKSCTNLDEPFISIKVVKKSH